MRTNADLTTPQGLKAPLSSYLLKGRAGQAWAGLSCTELSLQQKPGLEQTRPDMPRDGEVVKGPCGKAWAGGQALGRRDRLTQLVPTSPLPRLVLQLASLVLCSPPARRGHYVCRERGFARMETIVHMNSLVGTSFKRTELPTWAAAGVGCGDVGQRGLKSADREGRIDAGPGCVLEQQHGTGQEARGAQVKISRAGMGRSLGPWGPKGPPRTEVTQRTTRLAFTPGFCML